MKIYTGIGARDTPDEVLLQMEIIAFLMASENWILRSGGARGADSAFQTGVQKYCDRHNIPYVNHQEIYLPWVGFNNNMNPSNDNGIYHIINDKANELAEKYHPAYDQLTANGKKFMARNCYQILGGTLNIPTDLVVCWTKNGQIAGGTGQALRIAKDLKIDIFNLAIPGEYDRLIKQITLSTCFE